MDQTESAFVDQPDPDLRQLEASLAERHAELAHVVNELGQLYNVFAERSRTDIATLINENEGLRKELVEKDQRASDTVSDAGFPEFLQELELFKEENQRLRELLQEKQELLEEARRDAEAPREPIDLDSYEAELHRDRQQLEADRQKLNKELQQVRLRNEDLDEARREMEMEFSRERADLARERTRLERLREEVRAELERFQRDGGVRESLMSVHRLRESIAKEKSSQSSKR
jgi:DNA repair exonuclease SbcCD ATPase subunit